MRDRALREQMGIMDIELAKSEGERGSSLRLRLT